MEQSDISFNFFLKIYSPLSFRQTILYKSPRKKVQSESDSKTYETQNKFQYDENNSSFKSPISQKKQTQNLDLQMKDNLDLENKQKQKKFKCLCKKSYCQKRYCECYNNNEPCGNECYCYDCQNIILEINKKQKVYNQEKRGCNCKKTGCLKKYCECKAQGLECNEYCKCKQCQNCNDSGLQIQETQIKKIKFLL